LAQAFALRFVTESAVSGFAVAARGQILITADRPAPNDLLPDVHLTWMKVGLA
jgi:hypothetical protein